MDVETIHFSSKPSQMLITSIHYDRAIEAFVVQARDIDTPSGSLYTVIDIPSITEGNVAASKKLIEELKTLGDALIGFWDRCSIDMHEGMLTRDIFPVFGYMVAWWAIHDHDKAIIVEGYRCEGHDLWSLIPDRSVTIVPRPDTDVIPSSVRSNLERRVMCQTSDTIPCSSIASDV